MLRNLLFVRKIAGILVATALVSGFALSAAEKPFLTWKRGTLPTLGGKENPGVARPFAGISNGVAILAGGSNFAEKPLLEGGPKLYHSTIYALKSGSTEWSIVGELPGPIAEGVSVTTDRGIVCVGGTDGREDRATAFLMNWDPRNESVRFTPGAGAAASTVRVPPRWLNPMSAIRSMSGKCRHQPWGPIRMTGASPE